MYHHILIPTDGSSLSAHAVEQALTLARSMQATTTVLTVLNPFHAFAMTPELIADTRSQYERQIREQGARCVAAAEVVARAMGVPCDTAMVEHELPYEAIIETARERGADLIAMASHGRRGLSALVLGSETLKVLTHSNIPVLVFRK